MRIAVGLDGGDTPERIAGLIDAGADEFFAGFVPPEWSNRYGWEVGLNRRTFGMKSQYTSAGDLEQAIAIVHERGKRVFITFNAHSYNDRQIPILRDIVQTVDGLEPDGYIVADPALIALLAEWRIDRPLSLSTGAACFNSRTVRHYCKFADVRRVVIPRKLSLIEMEQLVRSLGDLSLEFEVMILGYRCHFNDEFCFSRHSGVEEVMCSYFYEAEHSTRRRFPRDWKSMVEQFCGDPDPQFQAGSLLGRFLQRREEQLPVPPPVPQTPHDPDRDLWPPLAFRLLQNCGLCAIPKLRQIGVHVLKVPVRGDGWVKERFLRLARQVIDHPNPTPEFCRQLVNSPGFCEATGHCYYHLGAGVVE